MARRKPKQPPDDPAQSKRFIDMAHEIGANATKEEFERALKKVIAPSKPGAGKKSTDRAKK